MPTALRSYNVLVVEDNPGDAHLIGEAFRECGHDCQLRFAETFEAAEELLKEQLFDLVLSDMGVRAGESGEFIRAIRSDGRLNTVPIIVLSGTPNPRLAYEAGANAFIPKSMDMEEFFSNIHALMHFWVRVAVLPTRTEDC